MKRAISGDCFEMSEHRARIRLALLLLSVSALAACGGSSTDSGAGTGTGSVGSGGGFGAAPGSGSGSSGGSGSGGSASAGVLSSFYVASFAPLETLATQIRASAKFSLQRTAWQLVAGGTVYHSDSLAAIRAEYAHAAGLTGKGQTVAVVDAGFLPGHEAFKGKSVTISGSPAVDNHGTSVASIIAGNSSTMTGVAPGASLLLGGWDTATTMATATQKALQMKAVAQNNSWGYTNINADASGFNSVFGTGAGSSYLSALDAYANYGVVLFAVSNDAAATRSGLMDALPSIRASLEPGWIAVANAVPTFDNTSISSVKMISSGCLQAARWCLLADGAFTAATATSATSYQFGTGSSFATPQVAGAMALLAEAFPTLTPHDLRLRLLASANNSFFTPSASLQIVPGFSHGYSSVYGHGFLDLRAALLPIGPTSFSVGGQKIATNTPVIATGSAMGDAVTKSLASVQVAVSDSLSAGFQLPATAIVAASQPAPLSRSLMSVAASTDLHRSRTDTRRTAVANFTSQPGRTVDLSTEDGAYAAALVVPDAEGSTAITLMRSLGDGATTLDLGLKLARDAGGTIGFGDTGQGHSLTDMVALEIGLRQENANGSFLSIGGEFGVANLGTANLITDVSQASFNSIGLEIGQRNAFADGDRVSLGVSMPMAVTAGSARVILPVAMSAGNAALQDLGLDLAPSDRQIDISIGYQKPMGEGQEFMMKLVHAINYGNRAGVTDGAAMVAYNFRF